MRTRCETLIDEINEKQKLIFKLKEKAQTIQQKIKLYEEDIKVAQANLREECK